MKVEIKTGKGTFLAVKVPEGASDLVLPKIGMADLYFHKEGDSIEEESYLSVGIPAGNWQLIGACKDLTEEQWAEVVMQMFDEKSLGGALFADYLSPSSPFPYIARFKTATESGLSLLKANKVYLVNPYGEMPVNSEFYWGYLEDLQQWQEAEERTGNWILIKKT